MKNKRTTATFNRVVGEDVDWEGQTYYVEYHLFVRWVYDYECADADGNRGIWLWSEDDRYIDKIVKVERYHRPDESGETTPLEPPFPAGLTAAIEQAAEEYDAENEMDDWDDEPEPPDREDD